MFEKIILIISLIFWQSGALFCQNEFSASVEIQNLSSVNNTMISGEVSNPTSRKLRVKYYRNNISLEEEFLEVPLLSENHFKFSFTLDAPNPIYLVLDNEDEVEIYVEPHDSLHFSFDGKSPLATLKFTGKGSDENSYLLASNRYFKKLKSTVLLDKFTGLDKEKKYQEAMTHVYEKMLSYFYDADQSGWTTSFQHFAKANIDYWWAGNLLKFKKRHRESLFPQYSDIEQFDYYHFLTKININNEFALNNGYYLDFLEQFVKFCNEYPNPQKYLPIVYKQKMEKKTKTSIQKFVKVHMQGLEVLKSPYPEKKEVLAKLDYGTELLYLRNKTTDYLKYRQGNNIYSAYFFQVKLSDTLSGWVSGAGISFLDRRVDNPIQDKVAYAPLTETTSVEQFLKGKVRYFVKAKSLYWKTFLNQEDDNFALELANFRDENPYPEYTKILSKAYEVAQLRGKGDMKLVKTYAFSNLKTPVIEGVYIQLPFGRKAKVTSSENANYHSKKQQFYEDVAIFDSNPCGQKTNVHLNLDGELVLYTNDLLFSEKRYPIQGNKTLNLNLYQPILGELIINKVHYPIKLTPGDDLSIVSSYLGKVKIPKYSQKGSAVNSFLRDINLKINPDYYLQEHFEKDMPSVFKKYILDIEAQKIDFISGYPTLTNIEKTYWKEDAKYWSAYQLLKYAEEQKTKQSVKLTDSYFTFMDNIDISKDWMLPNINYSYFLDSYLDYFELNADDVLMGEARNYQKGKALVYKCMATQAADAADDILKYIKDCQNPSYCETVTSVYNEQKGLIEGAQVIDFKLETVDGHQVALSDFKGKVIFLDFWASWCVPCIRSMYKSQQLIDDRKDVVFVSVSLDDDIDQWRSFVRSRNFKGIHLFLDRQKFGITDIQKIYQAFQLPKYILIDKNFNIAFPDAAKPGTALWNNQVMSLQKERMR